MLYGDALQFSMTYNLADDTVEIFSILGYNTGRDETFTRLLKRAKLPILIGTNILSGAVLFNCDRRRNIWSET